ncbi:MAG: hypothetical protein JST67_02530 [Bacteroidetes bacterium]|nr:hypothetical protein [Bacteroidota bacterium]
MYNNYTYTFYEGMQEVNQADWNEVVKKSNFFLQPDYLQTLEILQQPTLLHRFVIVYLNKKPVWVACFQITDFTAHVFGDLVENQIQELQSKRLKLFDRYLNKYKNNVLMRLITCGNNFVSGEHGFAHSKKINKVEALILLEKVCSLVSQEEKLRGTISATLVKDFYSKELPKEQVLQKHKFIEFLAEPNMLITIPEGVKSIEDYIQLFSKKYRNRVKNILKAKEPVEIKNLSWQEIQKYEVPLYALYENVFNRAKFKLAKLAPSYFYEMKKKFDTLFYVQGYFLESHLVAFSSGFFLPNNVLEAHYIGIDYKVNKEYELYQNMLLDFVEAAITHKKSTLNLGRTAAEIKSTIGAQAHNLVCYIRPQNTVSKAILTPFINYLQPTSWVPRNPFKEV